MSCVDCFRAGESQKCAMFGVLRPTVVSSVESKIMGFKGTFSKVLHN